MSSYLKCTHCGYTEKLTKSTFVKVIGGAVSGGGFWAWVTYLFAGTGFAMAICIAIVTGGVAIAAYSDEIAQWFSKKYPCPSCGSRYWHVTKG